MINGKIFLFFIIIVLAASPCVDVSAQQLKGGYAVLQRFYLYDGSEEEGRFGIGKAYYLRTAVVIGR